MSKPKVPAGLKRCRKCGHFKGRCIDPDPTYAGITVKVGCACNPHTCHRCGKPIFKHRICSNYYHEQSGDIIHVPIFTAWAHRCPDGTTGQKENSALISAEMIKRDPAGVLRELKKLGGG